MSSEKAAPLIKRYVIQVNPGRPRLGIDLTLCPKSVVPDALNQRTEFTARIYAFKDGKWVYPGEKRKITFSLEEVSRERGVCMNYPIKDKNNITPASAIASNTNPDLFFPEARARDDDYDKMKDFDFDEDETDGDADKKCPTEILTAGDNPAHSHHYQKVTTKKAVTEAKVVVRCEDYGAFGILKAEADECESLKPREREAGCSKDLGDNDVRIPRDCNKPDRNYIADSAKSWDNVSLDKYRDGSDAKANEDKDNEPETDKYEGDGLTNYEEYRGFIVIDPNTNIKEHIRTNINKKDIFIRDRDGLGPGFFNQTGLTFHFISDPEFHNGDSTDGNGPPDANTQIINFNRGDPREGRGSGNDQHSIRLVDENIVRFIGYTFGGPGLPRVINRVAVDRVKHAGWAPDQIKNTIAHELGHSINLWHHGDKPDCPACGNDPARGITSGRVDCIMRYDNYRRNWCHKVGGACHTHPIPNPENPGTTYCDSTNGTGCNVIIGHFRNDADTANNRGNCKSHIRVKDW